MLRALRPWAPRGARQSRLTVSVRWTLALLVSLTVSVPSALAGPVCGMESDGSGCARCEGKLAAEPAPPCHAKPELKPVTAACHESGTAGDCCSLEQQDLPSALLFLPFHATSLSVADAALAPAPSWFFANCGDPGAPAATESPPGSTGLLVAQTTILRL